MKVPDTDIDIRIEEPPEKIKMVAHSAECRYCKGIVKMMRSMETGRLQPDNCQCLLCGQRYFVEIEGDIYEWELNQWRQKAEKCSKREESQKEESQKEDDRKVVITMRCIDMASPTSNVDKVPCSECGEMTWLSPSFRKMKVDKIICNPCFEKYKDKDYHARVTEECINDALASLESRGIRTTKEEMIRRMEEKIGKKLAVTKLKKR